ncbi:site-specific integrase [Pseudomonas sp. PvP046]|uniref:site-specific integrase n=1 Tax=Pseudomonas sp. PvP046 TaxID=3156389 RepID=UPI003395F2D7
MISVGSRRSNFRRLAQVPAAVEWFANLDNPRTRRAYQNDLEDFCGFVGLASADEFRVGHPITCFGLARQLEHRGLAGATIRRKLAALASLFDHLLESNASPGAIPCMASNARRSKATKARLRHWAITRPKRCSKPRMKRPSKGNCVIGRYWLFCFITGCAAKKRRCCR